MAWRLSSATCLGFLPDAEGRCEHCHGRAEDHDIITPLVVGTPAAEGYRQPCCRCGVLVAVDAQGWRQLASGAEGPICASCLTQPYQRPVPKNPK